MATAVAEPAADELTEFQWEDDEDDDRFTELPENFVPPPAALRKQRHSVSAECFTPTQDFTRKVVSKTEEERASIRTKLDSNILFSGLDEDQKGIVVDAVERVSFSADHVIIQQGDKEANMFYILEEGTAVADVSGATVKEYEAGGSFGELALLYNAPRAATVRATSDVSCWALDRDTFRSTVIQSMHTKRATYDAFLKEVPLLQSLADDERAAIADVLEPQFFNAGEDIIKEGDPGTSFFILEDGTCKAVSVKNQAEMSYKRGDYFGELALLHDETRQATVTATTRAKVVSMDSKAFKRLLGSLRGILMRNEEQYHKLRENGVLKD